MSKVRTASLRSYTNEVWTVTSTATSSPGVTEVRNSHRLYLQLIGGFLNCSFAVRVSSFRLRESRSDPRVRSQTR